MKLNDIKKKRPSTKQDMRKDIPKVVPVLDDEVDDTTTAITSEFSDYLEDLVHYDPNLYHKIVNLD